MSGNNGDAMSSDGLPTRPRLVLAAGEQRTAARATVVVGFDNDDVSRAALDVAADLGRRLAARLVVVHVVNLGDYPLDPEGEHWEEQGQQVLAEERRTVEQVLAGHPFGFVYEIRYGSPVVALAAAVEAHDALLVVVGRHGGVSGALRRLLQGSVSRRLPRRTTRPVLLVPRP